MALGVCLLGGVGGWAATATLSNAVLAEATVIIEGSVKKVQHLTGGIVSELTAKEGAHVEAGEVVVRLDGTSIRANLAIINSTLAQLYARRARLEAERLGRDSFSIADLAASGVDLEANRNLAESEVRLFRTRKSALIGMKKQLEERKEQLAQEISGEIIQISAVDEATALIEEEFRAINSLYEQQLVTMQRLNSLKRQRVELQGNRGQRIAARAQAEGRINEINLQILQLDEERGTENAKDLTEIEANVAEMEERRVALMDQLRRMDVRAPLDGRIYQLAVHTVGGVVNPGEALMLLAPDQQKLTLEAKIAPRNIDQVRPGQKVEIRFSAFDQRTTPEIEGEVAAVSPDVVTDERTGASYYPVRVEPVAESIAKLQNISLYPGMPAEIFIKVGDRSVISYFAKPLTDQMRHTFREE
jgi:membrane fusion protein